MQISAPSQWCSFHDYVLALNVIKFEYRTQQSLFYVGGLSIAQVFFFMNEGKFCSNVVHENLNAT